MGVWVVILEAVATEADRSGLDIEPGALDDLADELASNYAVVTALPGAYETELWIEEGTAGAAVLAAQRLCQAAVRFLGLPAWEVVRAEARNAHALETGAIDWPDPPVPADRAAEIEAGFEAPPIELDAPPTRAKKAPVKKGRAKKAPAAATKAPTKKAAARSKAPAGRAPAKKTRKGPARA